MRVIAAIVVVILLSSGVAVIGEKEENQTPTKSLSFSFQEPMLIDDGAYVKVLMDGAPACLYQAGKPVLPMYTTTIQLPFGTRISNVSLQHPEQATLTLSKKITPTPYPLIIGAAREDTISVMDETVYDSADMYPQQWMRYSTGGGLNERNEHTTFLTLQVFPVRYSPRTDSLTYLRTGTVVITYEPPTRSPFPPVVIFDLVIITPKEFLNPLQRLAAHKNNIGVRTQIVTVDQIYRDYPGVDQPEQIKYFIKDTIETWGSTYVLLVGGLKSHIVGKPRDDINKGVRDWYLPVRYSNLWDYSTTFDPGFISDLYYADIYDGQGDFCNWDSCGDGVFGGWSNPSNPAPLDYPTDQIDFYPDVNIGRLPCRNVLEVSFMVNKIIAYETKPIDPSWFRTMVVIGGDPYDDTGTNYLEGELVGEKALSFMPGFEPKKLFASNQEINPEFTPLTKNIIREINAGCGFLFFDGHGSPAWWNTFWPGQFNNLITNGGLSIYTVSRLRHTNQLPICVIGGCHCCQFNVTVLATMLDLRNTHSMWSNGLPISECLGWAVTQKRNGGAIATIGSTGIGYEASGENGDLNGDLINDPDCVEALGGFLETQFFRAYGSQNITILGNAWCTTITQYLNIYPGMQNRSDAKTIEQWVLLGDPSLRIGGYTHDGYSSGI